VSDIIGLYLQPPQHAAIFCVDEKTAIQALDRLDPVLPLSPGRAERHGFEYYRRGTLALYAALDTKTRARIIRRPAKDVFQSGFQPCCASIFGNIGLIVGSRRACIYCYNGKANRLTISGFGGCTRRLD
jgi:hypothetical protein